MLRAFPFRLLPTVFRVSQVRAYYRRSAGLRRKCSRCVRITNGEAFRPGGFMTRCVIDGFLVESVMGERVAF